MSMGTVPVCGCNVAVVTAAAVFVLVKVFWILFVFDFFSFVLFFPTYCYHMDVLPG